LAKIAQDKRINVCTNNDNNQQTRCQQMCENCLKWIR